MANVKLHRLRQLQRFTLCAADGEIGKVEEVYFDDSNWSVRYLVVNTGGWLMGRRVLISPVAVGELDEQAHTLYIELSQEQIENSPPLGADQPVSRQYEQEYLRYYGWPPYWQSDPFSAAQPSFDPHRPLPPFYDTWREGKRDNHLRSSDQVSGYRLDAEDGEFGHVADFVIDDQYWKVRYLEIDTRNWWPGKHVLLNPAWIERVHWLEKSVTVDLCKEDILTAPAYDPKAVISRDYEIKLLEHYARRKYWE
ncbi:hypothetical protein Tel_12340 [Candidatus Tenderia electrophaga]|jgi:hypothetical protein|uniref:PRC-barrel domain-containing protein n=1 Tax=Candidatus Tenderia electrophaga TaxID=1748243 RepID=A0A0S2TFI6_9GAMM|nr:hypothetical protein Tel_12340 [Candidatus Tenderia electrophaga]